ncbi:hypothetical protein IGB42_00220 [Andreprevotia sp. IGB-42]|nr:hypothetical protein IGB42_00220 [Andreprevotia sp. IGB-42]
MQASVATKNFSMGCSGCYQARLHSTALFTCGLGCKVANTMSIGDLFKR